MCHNCQDQGHIAFGCPHFTLTLDQEQLSTLETNEYFTIKLIDHLDEDLNQFGYYEEEKFIVSIIGDTYSLPLLTLVLENELYKYLKRILFCYS